MPVSDIKLKRFTWTIIIMTFTDLITYVLTGFSNFNLFLERKIKLERSERNFSSLVELVWRFTKRLRGF